MRAVDPPEHATVAPAACTRTSSGPWVFVAVAFLSLFYFIDFVDELDSIGRNGYTALHAAAAAALELPGHFYELAPICVADRHHLFEWRRWRSRRSTDLRTRRPRSVRALGLAALLGLFFGAVTFAIGDYLSPLSRREAVLRRRSFRVGLQLGPTGAG